MNRQEYFDYLKATSEVVQPIIERAYEKYINDEGLSSALLPPFASKRLNNGVILQKPSLFRLAYETLGGKDFERLLEVAAALEMLNISSYQSNGSFDEKYGVNNHREHDNQFIAATLSREAITPLVLDSKALTNKEKTRLLKTIATVIRYGYEGQFIDLNKIGKNNGCLDLPFEEYLQLYLRRCFLLSGVFTAQTCRLAAELANSNTNSTHDIEMMGAYFGTALHIINDLSDFIPPEFLSHKPTSSYKRMEDQWSDLRNGRVTLATWLVLHKSSYDKIAIRIESWAEEKTLERLVVKVMKEGGIGGGFSVASALKKKANGYLHQLPKSQTRDLFSAMVGTIKSNRFMHVLREIAQTNAMPDYSSLVFDAMEQIIQKTYRSSEIIHSGG